MRQAGVVTWLAVRELWISFRLLVVLVAFIVPGALVALLPAAPAVSLERVAGGLGLAATLTAALAAWSLSDERTSGRAGWLVTRSVSRGTYLVGWFVALAGVVLAGVTGAGILAWLAASAPAARLEWSEFATALVGIGATAGGAIALGLAIGSLARPWGAALLAAATCLALGAPVLLAPDLAPITPSAAFQALPGVLGPDAGMATALRGAGIGLSLSAALLVVARIGLERAEL